MEKLAQLLNSWRIYANKTPKPAPQTPEWRQVALSLGTPSRLQQIIFIYVLLQINISHQFIMLMKITVG